MNRLNNRPLILAARRAAALCASLALLLPLVAPVIATAQKMKQSQPVTGKLAEDRRVLHVLNRLGFGARPGDVERVRAQGLERYIEEQLYPEKIADAAMEAKLQRLEALRMTTPELYAKYPQPNQLLRRMQREGQLPPELAAAVEERLKGNAGNMPQQQPGASPAQSNGTMTTEGNDAARANEGARNNEYRRAIRDYYQRNGLRQPQQLIAELQASRILRAVYSERQLQEVMVDFWENHFNIFAGKGADRWLLISYDRDTIRPNTLGKFKDLLTATAQSPAMLFYLDNFQSVSPNAQQRRRPLIDGLMRRQNQRGQQMPNQQQARPQQQQRQRRGINENYARELMELHTLGVEGGYTQKDVQEVARCFTGWTIRAPRGAGGADPDAGTFFFNERVHDNGEKVVLGQKIPAGGGMKDGLMVLDILARHPSTAKFLATKLARRFVMDNPTPELVARISAAYTKSDGSIRETLRAVITSPEFNSQAAYRAKIKTPFELATSAIRTLGGETNGGPAIHQWIARMGEPLYMYQAPTGYPDTAEDWVNTGSLLERLNFALALASNRIPGTRVDLSRFAGAGEAAASIDKAKVMERFIGVILNGDVSGQTKATLTKQLNEPLPAPASTPARDVQADTMQGAEGRERRGARQMARADTGRIIGNPEVVKIAGLILGSPEFQRQ